nr:hypothetical protein [Tanacetum cinerariifolium]
MEAEEDEDMKVKDNEDENDAEIIHPYEEANPLNRPPPSPETAEQGFMNAPVSQSTLQPIPPFRQFAGTFYEQKHVHLREHLDHYLEEVNLP